MMRQVIRIPPPAAAPAPEAVLRRVGVPPRAAPGPRLEALLEEALQTLAGAAAPAGVLVPIAITDFARVYQGEGGNEPETPLAGIFPRADDLALFAVTLGPRVVEKISRLFASRDYALASLVDAAASEATEAAAGFVEGRFRETLTARGRLGPAAGLLRYSPGYCGWHVSGQGALLSFVRAEEIGIRLRESFLMEPLKSVSGVIVSGPREIHVFADDFGFCHSCRTRTCRARIRDVMAGGE
jgi:hypothetical protein